MVSITDNPIDKRASIASSLRLMMFRVPMSQQRVVFRFQSALTAPSPYTHRPTSHWPEQQHLLRLHGALHPQVRFIPAPTTAAPVTVALTMRLSLLPQATCSDPSPSAPDVRPAQGVEAQEENPWSHAHYIRPAPHVPCSCQPCTPSLPCAPCTHALHVARVHCLPCTSFTPCAIQVVQDALSEDAGDLGDVTTLAT